MLTITKPTNAQKEVVQIHVRLIDNLFFQNTDSQMQTLSAATAMTHAPFVDFFCTMVSKNKEHALNSPLHQAFKHCFPNKEIVIDETAPPMETVCVVDVPISKEHAIAIVEDLLSRTQDDYDKLREVQAIANIVKTANPDTYLHWIRLARLAAVGEPLDQKHTTKD